MQYAPILNIRITFDLNPYRTQNEHDTVGAIAIDTEGNVAYASSSGGRTGNIDGRVGDTSIPGQKLTCFGVFVLFCNFLLFVTIDAIGR